MEQKRCLSEFKSHNTLHKLLLDSKENAVVLERHARRKSGDAIKILRKMVQTPEPAALTKS